jgi:hypothetical protein
MRLVPNCSKCQKSFALLNANKTLLSAHSFLGVLVCKQKKIMMQEFFSRVQFCPVHHLAHFTFLCESKSNGVWSGGQGTGPR